MEHKILAENDTLGVPEEERREFLKQAGKFAAYTPPTLLALMYPGAHAIASGGNRDSKQSRKAEQKEAKRKIKEAKRKEKSTRKRVG